MGTSSIIPSGLRLFLAHGDDELHRGWKKRRRRKMGRRRRRRMRGLPDPNSLRLLCPVQPQKSLLTYSHAAAHLILYALFALANIQHWPQIAGLK